MLSGRDFIFCLIFFSILWRRLFLSNIIITESGNRLWKCAAEWSVVSNDAWQWAVFVWIFSLQSPVEPGRLKTPASCRRGTLTARTPSQILVRFTSCLNSPLRATLGDKVEFLNVYDLLYVDDFANPDIIIMKLLTGVLLLCKGKKSNVFNRYGVSFKQQDLIFILRIVLYDCWIVKLPLQTCSKFKSRSQCAFLAIMSTSWPCGRHGLISWNTMFTSVTWCYSQHGELKRNPHLPNSNRPRVSTPHAVRGGRLRTRVDRILWINKDKYIWMINKADGPGAVLSSLVIVKYDMSMNYFLNVVFCQHLEPTELNQ